MHQSDFTQDASYFRQLANAGPSETTMMMHTGDKYTSEKLSQMVDTANKYRTRACGMNSMLDRSIRSKTDYGKKKLPGQSVTYDEIDVQRTQRRIMKKKPPVPKVGGTTSRGTIRSDLSKPYIKSNEHV